MSSLKVFADRQQAELWSEGNLKKVYSISSAANGLGCLEGSHCTPTGKLRVSQKIGEGLPLGAVLKARVPTGEIYSAAMNSQEDLVLTRVLWLEGAEEKNANTLQRYIYLHGTNQEHLLGTAASHGCIRFSNEDIVEVFAALEVGDEVEVFD